MMASSTPAIATRHGIYRRKYHMRALLRSIALLLVVTGFAIFGHVDNGTESTQTKTNLSRRLRLVQGVHDVPHGHLRDPPQSPLTVQEADMTLLVPEEPLFLTRHRRTEVKCDDIDKSEPRWFLVWYIIGVMYMFLALAIVCDEFFVPALEEMSSERRLNLSMDVAGATLMAAGGSAPELFTSLFGTFTESEIGFGTIVGSAVFNVLFVIGMCSLLAKEVLQLTWWPLFRDSFCYAVGLIVLAIFTGVTSDNKIELWEAIVLFVMYLVYIVIMYFNKAIYKKITGKELTYPEEDGDDGAEKNKPEEPADEESPTTTPAGDTTDGDGAATPAGDNTVEDGRANGDGSARNVESAQRPGLGERVASQASLVSGGSLILDYHTNHRHTAGPRWQGTFRAGILKLLRDPDSWVDTAGVGIVAKIAGDADHVFRQVDINGDGSLDKEELGVLFDKLDLHLSPEELDEVFATLDEDQDGKISEKEFTQWYVRSEERILSRVKHVFDHFDVDHSGTIDRAELKMLLEKLEPRVTDEDVEEAIDAMYKSGSREEITFDEFSEWYRHSIIYERQRKAVEEDMEGVWESLKPPRGEGCVAWAKYLLYLPLVASMALTIPDTQRPGMSRWCYVSFIMSILWIGVFSFLMVDWSEIIGNTIGIPSVVMGYTILAAGTSVPDLLSSVIVARRGSGDMAVSSSIGSNIFDILVGLPIPWILFIAWPSKPNTVDIGSDGIFYSLCILLGMLVFVIACTHCQGWKLTRKLGAMMFAFYVVFLVVVIVIELPFETCIPNNPGGR